MTPETSHNLEPSPRSQVHPDEARTAVGTGATAGAAAGAAIALAAVGPIAIPLAAFGGLIVGALAGKGLAEARRPSDEADYWREQHSRQPYAKERPYDDFIEAYRVGYQGYGRRQPPGSFEEREAELRDHYEELRSPDSLPWDEAKHATRAAWERLARNEDGIVGYIAVEANGDKVGLVHTVWRDGEGRPLFAGVTTVWAVGNVHVVPLAEGWHYDRETRTVSVPFTGDSLRAAPLVDPSEPLREEDQRRSLSHFETEGGPILRA